MSSIVIKGDTSGQIEIAAPDVAGSTTLTLPTGTGTVITTNNIDSNPPASLSTATGSAPSYSARAWVYFNGTGTVAINASGNVSSITDNGVGSYSVNFSTAMPDVNYSVGCFSGRNANPDIAGNGNVRTTSSFNISTGSHTGASSFTSADVDSVSIQVFR